MTGLPALRLAVANLLAAAAYLLLSQLCLALATIGPHVSPLWLPAGLGLALLVLFGPRLLAGIWLGHAAANVLAGAPWHVALLVGFGCTAAVWFGAALFCRWLPAGISGSARAPARFLAIAYGSAALAGLYGPMVLWLFGEVPAASLDVAIIVWWLGDALGMVVLAPAVLAWRETPSRQLFGREAAATATTAAVAAAVATTTVALALLTFVAERLFLPNVYLQAALLLPPMMWLTMRCHPVVPLSVNVAVVTGLVYGAAGTLGASLGETPVDRAYALHGFVLIASVTLLFLAAHIHRVREMAAAARAGEERFRRLTTLTSDWYWEQDADYRFTFFDGPVFGDPLVQAPLLIGRRRWEIPGVEPCGTSWEAHRADLDAHRTFVGLLVRYTGADRRTTYYSTSGEPVFDEQGRFAGYRGVGRNVTPEVESREALLASERQFHEVADATFEGLLIHDYGRIVFANQAVAELVGRSIDDIVGCQLVDFVSAEERAHAIRQLAQDDQQRHFETVGLHADGRRFPVEVFGRSFVFQGKTMSIVAIRDITARRRIEAALSAQVEFQRTLLDTIPNPVFYKDRAGRYLGYNPAFCKLFGIGMQDYVGRTVFDIAPADLAARYQAADEELFSRPGIQVYEAQIHTPGGRRDVVFHKATFTEDSGAVAGLVGIIIDITDRKQAEDRLRRFQELSPAAIGIVDVGGKVLYINPAAQDLFGFTLADVPTMEAWWSLAYPDPAYRADRRAAWLSAVELALREGRSMLRFEGRVHCRDGRARWIETLASLGEQEIFMIFTDLTDYIEGGVLPPL